MPTHFEQEQGKDRGHLNRFAQSCKELSLLGKLAATAAVVNVPAAILGGVEVATDNVDETTYGFLAFNGGTLAAIAGVALWKRHQRNKPGDRDFSRAKSFSPYVHTTEDGDIYDSPFPVTVVGINDELLGVGKLIGGLGTGEDAMPVIAVQDKQAENGQVELLGVECWWTPLEDEFAAALATERGGRAITPVAWYLRSLDID